MCDTQDVDAPEADDADDDSEGVNRLLDRTLDLLFTVLP